MRWAGGSRALGAAHAREFSPSRSADNNLIAGRLSPSGLAYYTASETLARPGSRARFQLSTINYQLSTNKTLLGFGSVAVAAAGGGGFAQRMACGAFYAASETLALPGTRCR